MIIKKIQKKDGSTVYRGRQYLGIDEITGKKVVAVVTGKTKVEVKQKANQKITEFNNKGRTHYHDQQERKKRKQELNAPTFFSEIYKLWLNTLYVDSVKKSTLDSTMSYMNNHVLPYWSDKAVKEIARVDIQIWINELSKRASHYKRVYGYFRMVLDFAVSLDIIPSNPCNGVIVPKKLNDDTSKIKHFTNEQVKQFYSYLDSLNPFDFSNVYHATLYKLALATGCRIGELIALEWSDIDFNKRTISITKTYDNKNKIINTPKTKNSYRTIYLDEKTVKILKQYKKRQSNLFKRDITLVFHWSLERAYPHYSGLNRTFHKHLKSAGLPVVGFHAFRHTHASMLIENGIDPKTLQVRLGHAKISTTLDIYTHISDEKEKNAVDFFEKAMNW